ncbi:MAG TPA: hypothetical protein VMH33_11785 [Solirubrobacterales bacterium]|nr:hypothetical protein [Solirubrobacterales bacterium]
MLKRLLVGLVVTAFLVVTTAAFGASPPSASSESAKEVREATPGATPGNPFPSPHGLRIRGAHGYSIVLNASPGASGNVGRLHVAASGRAGRVYYSARVDLRNEGLKANLGRFGRVDLRWVPAGGVSEVTERCHHHPRRFFFVTGAYVGTLRFRGGRGFTTARARRVVWRRAWYADASICSLGIQEGTPGPGEHLEAGAKGTKKLWQSPTSLDMVQEKQGAPIAYEARQNERVGQVGLERVAWAWAGGKTLNFEPDFSSAEIHPPAPFSGSARFEATKGSRGSWLGDLLVDFPDRPDVRLAGKTFEASFESYFHVVREEL